MNIKSVLKLNYLLILILAFNRITFSQFNEYHPEVDWFTIETENFFVHYHKGTERTANVIAKIAEEIVGPITALYGYHPGKVHFVIKDLDDYANGATYFFDNKIEIWASALDFELRGTTNWLRNVISHEYTHMVQLQAAMKLSRRVPAVYFQWLNYENERRPDVLYGFPNGIVSYPVAFLNIPPWFAEGCAQYMRREFEYDFWDTHRDMILRAYVLDGKMLTWGQMSSFGKTSLGNESVYNSGFALVNYIAQKYGEAKIKQINDYTHSFFNFTIDAAIYKALGKTAEELYKEWQDFLTKDYQKRIEPILNNKIEGRILADEGFGNLFPIFSKDGSKIYYISNKNQDYFITSLYEFDINTKKETLIQPGVFSIIDLSSDGKKLIYAKITDENPYNYKTHDLYIYDLINKKETRLTNGLRANNPTFSNDNKKITFVSQKDGTVNIFTIDVDGNNLRKITDFNNGEQVYSVRFSPDDSYLIFDYSLTDERGIYRINADGTELRKILDSSNDERSPVFINKDEILYSADYTGIFNLYKYNLVTNEKKQLTNVIGGAFMPALYENKLAYIGYTSGGFKLYLIDDMNSNSVIEGSSYIPRINHSFIEINNYKDPKFDWEKLKNFDDTKYDILEAKKYSGSFTNLTILPFLRVENYSKQAKGLELLKPGVYFYSNDMLNRFGIMGAFSINSRMERDLFLSLEYRDRIPLFYQLGLRPELTLEGYNVSRTTTQVLGFNPDTLDNGQIKYDLEIPVDISYNLLEFDFKARHKIFNENHHLTFSFVFSRYESIIESFILPDKSLYPTTRDVYLIGRQLGIKYNFEDIVRNVDDDINPLGTRLSVKFDYEFDKFNPDSQYEIKDGLLVPLYKNITFSRLELNLTQNYLLPWFRHSIGYRLRLGTTLGSQVDEFFDFYLGGFIGMKGYPFYAISGNEVAYLNLFYRFPVLKNIDLQFGPFYLDKIFASVYGDLGNAWNDKAVKLKDFKKGVGAEVRFQFTSFYIFPTSIFFNVAYAFDEYVRNTRVTKEQVKYGKEFRFYFGVLFDFDFIQDTFKF